jgi:GNAT superfamily N-acetyltransferase
MAAECALVPRIDSNLFEFYEYAAKAVGKSCVQGPGYRHVALRPSPWANLVFDLRLENEDSCIGLAQYISECGLPNKITTGPTSTPPDIDACLLAAGFARGATSRGMVLELARRRRSASPLGLTFSPVTRAEQFEAFASIVASNLFDTKPETAPAFATLLRAMDPAKAFGLLGSYEGSPVSTAFAYIDGWTCGGLYFVATEAGYRGRGFGAATVSSILDELELRGVAGCILQATELGKPVYESLGFADICDLGRFALPEGWSMQAKKGVG